MDLSMFGAVAGGLNQTYQAGKALLELKLSADVTMRVTALVTQLGEVAGKFAQAQIAHIQCQERAMELEKEVARLKAFEAEKARYTLQALGPDSFAHVVKPDLQGEEPPHALCCSCFADGTKSILQYARHAISSVILVCPRCKAEVHRSREPDEPMFVTAPGSFDD